MAEPKIVIFAQLFAVKQTNIPTYQWPRWSTGLSLEENYESSQRRENEEPKLTKLKDGVSLLKLPDLLISQDWKCLNAFRLWQMSGKNGIPSFMFIFVQDPPEVSEDGMQLFRVFCKRRLFRKGTIYENVDSPDTSLALYAPYQPFNQKFKAPPFRWWITVHDGRFVPEMRSNRK